MLAGAGNTSRSTQTKSARRRNEVGIGVKGCSK